jgi:hypothetical protein
VTWQSCTSTQEVPPLADPFGFLGVAVDAAGNVYVEDNSKMQVVKLQAG